MSTAARSRSAARSTTPRKARIPVFIFAGLSPSTQEGEATGSRNEFIQWIQDVPDQRGIVRQYMKYDNELRTAAQRQADRASLAADRPQRSQGAGLPRRRPRGDGSGNQARCDRRRRMAADRADAAAEAAVASLVDALQKAARPLDRHLLCRPQSRRCDRARPLLPPARRGRARVGAELRQLSAQRSALPGQSLEPSVPEPRAGRGRFHSGHR